MATTTTTTMSPMADESTATILSALSTLPDSLLSSLFDSVLADTHHRHRRISTILSSPALFSLTLLHLLSLSLPDKSLLASRLLISSLRCLTLPFDVELKNVESLHCPRFPRMVPGDEDAVLLLLLLCDLQHRHPQALQEAPPCEWRRILKDLCYDTMLSLYGIGSALVTYIETAVRCHRFVSSMACPTQGEEEEAAASASSVLRLPWVEVGGRGRECMVCWEEMKEGRREACELPCRHLFHWTCIMPWLRKRNTCPSCRYEMPTDDVSGEIRRLWNVLMKKGNVH